MLFLLAGWPSLLSCFSIFGTFPARLARPRVQNSTTVGLIHTDTQVSETRRRRRVSRHFAVELTCFVSHSLPRRADPLVPLCRRSPHHHTRCDVLPALCSHCHTSLWLGREDERGRASQGVSRPRRPWNGTRKLSTSLPKRSADIQKLPQRVFLGIKGDPDPLASSGTDSAATPGVVVPPPSRSSRFLRLFIHRKRAPPNPKTGASASASDPSLRKLDAGLEFIEVGASQASCAICLCGPSSSSQALHPILAADWLSLAPFAKITTLLLRSTSPGRPKPSAFSRVATFFTCPASTRGCRFLDG